MNILRVIILFGFFAIPMTELNAQSRWIQCFVDGLQSDVECRALEQLLSDHEGVASVRTEHINGNLLIFLEDGVSVSQQVLEEWVEEGGKEIWCYRTGVRGVDPIVRISRNDCEGNVEKHE